MIETVTLEEALLLFEQGATWLINDGQCIENDPVAVQSCEVKR